jgi:Mor family transcriptional regulator
MNKFNEQLMRDRIKRAKRLSKAYDSGATVKELARRERISEKRVYALIASLK